MWRVVVFDFDELKSKSYRRYVVMFFVFVVGILVFLVNVVVLFVCVLFF